MITCFYISKLVQLGNQCNRLILKTASFFLALRKMHLKELKVKLLQGMNIKYVHS